MSDIPDDADTIDPEILFENDKHEPDVLMCCRNSHCENLRIMLKAPEDSQCVACGVTMITRDEANAITAGIGMLTGTPVIPVSDDEEKRFVEAVHPTYEDGFRHGVNAGRTTDWTDEDREIVGKHPELQAWIAAKITRARELEATNRGYADMLRSSDAAKDAAEAQTQIVEGQRSELIGLLRGFRDNWLRGNASIQAAEWLVRWAQIIMDYQLFGSPPNIVNAEAHISGKGGAGQTVHDREACANCRYSSELPVPATQQQAMQRPGDIACKRPTIDAPDPTWKTAWCNEYKRRDPS